MSQNQPIRDQQVQSGPTTPPDDGRIQYPDVPSREEKVESDSVGDQVNAPANDPERPSGTELMGDPVKPGHQQTRDLEVDPKRDDQRGEKPGSGQGNPYVQQPEPTSSPNQKTRDTNPYVQTSSADNAGKTPMDSIQDVFSKWTKKAEGYTGNAGSYWTHLSTGPNMTETALGRLSAGTKVITGGGLANVFKKEFPLVSDNEQLLKTYASYLSTSTGPVAGTLFLSTDRVTFVSDRPLAINNPQQSGDEQSWHYYKVAVPIDKVRSVTPTENPKKVSEKYIQVETTDQHEFWFMGFINYDKAVKNLQEAVNGKENMKRSDTATTPQSDTTVETDQQPEATAPPQRDTSPPPASVTS